MEKIDFAMKKRQLHEEIYREIIKLMEKNNVTEVDFSNDYLDSAFVVRSVSGAESTEEIKVKKIRLSSDGFLEYQSDQYNEENEWYSLSSDGDVLWCIISGIYNNVYDKFYKYKNEEKKNQ